MDDENIFQELSRKKRERQAFQNLVTLLRALFHSKIFWIVFAIMVSMQILAIFLNEIFVKK